MEPIGPHRWFFDLWSDLHRGCSDVPTARFDAVVEALGTTRPTRARSRCGTSCDPVGGAGGGAHRRL
jgi:hypothetical protein